MIFWGRTFSGAELFLGEPKEAVLSYDRDAPADLLRAVFPADSLWEELGEVTLYQDGEPVFRGMVDEQNVSLTSAGLTVELVCRSLEGLLLDNEALPETISAPSLPTLEAKLLTPLGLALGEGNRDTMHGELTVSKGDSCWTVLADFCSRYLGTEPYVDCSGRVHCTGGEEKHIELSEVISAQLQSKPCKRISEVWQQSFRGTYDTRYKSGVPGAVRRRYLSTQSGKDPREILSRGEQEGFSLTVLCAGAIWPGRNALVSVELPGVGRFEHCPVQSIQYRRGSSGDRTRLVLAKPAVQEEPAESDGKEEW